MGESLIRIKFSTVHCLPGLVAPPRQTIGIL
jgi:hypothetical protein